MKQFEYDVENIPIDRDYLSRLNKRGEQGWQVVGTNTLPPRYYAVTFMREIEKPAEQPINYKHNHSIDQTCWMDCPLRGTHQEIR